MKPTRFVSLAALFLFALASTLPAYDIKGAKPISELSEAQAKAKADKKLITLVYKGSDNQCPHCAAAAANGVKAVQSSSVMVLITEKEWRNQSLVSKLPKPMQTALKDQFGGAYVSFNVFDPDITKVVASGDRHSLENDQKKIHAFTKAVHDAKAGMQDGNNKSGLDALKPTPAPAPAKPTSGQ